MLAPIKGIRVTSAGVVRAGSVATEEAAVVSRSIAAKATVIAEEIGPGIGRSNYRTMEAFRDAVFERYQQFYDMAFARVQARVAAGRLSGDALTVGNRTDAIARSALRRWLASSEGIVEGPGRIIQVNRWLRDPSSAAFRIPDVRIPGANIIFDGTIGTKTSVMSQVVDFRSFSGGNNIVIVRPTQIGGSYGIVFS